MWTLEQLLEEWKSDSKLDHTHLDDASRDIPKMHSKYLEEHTQWKLRLKKQNLDMKVLLQKKFLYYGGKLTQAEITAEGWAFDPFKGLKIMKGDLHYYYDADDDIQAQLAKINYSEVMLETFKEIMDSIRWRASNVKNILDYMRFTSGG